MQRPNRNKPDYNRRVRLATVIFGVFGLVIIPVYTVALASKANWLDYTLSIIGNSFGHLRSLVTWGVLSASFFLSFTIYLFRLTLYYNRRVVQLLRLSCVLLVLTVIIPFLPEDMPFWADVHNTFAMTSPILMMVVLYMFIFHLQKLDAAVYKKALTFLSIVVAISAALLFLVGISSLLEVAVSLLMCAFLFALLMWVRGSSKIDSVGSLEKSYQLEEQIKANARSRRRKGAPPE